MYPANKALFIKILELSLRGPKCLSANLRNFYLESLFKLLRNTSKVLNSQCLLAEGLYVPLHW